MKIRDLRPRAAVTALARESLLTAADRLAAEEVGALVIFGATGCEGVLSERDVIRALADEADLESESIHDYMTATPLMISQDADVQDAVDGMTEFGVRHLVVTDGPDVVGVISARDVLQVLARQSV